MNFIQLSPDTAPAARAALTGWSPLPRAHLTRGLTALALVRFQTQTHSLIDASSNAALTRCASIATFADTVRSTDADLAAALEDFGLE
ncbi:hypothetical protein G7Y29_09550 [Corynebacterium qintianiae]|uniref:Uncharacterized protein n=1 Tax=Corynebacterium qintianiae TaxID=2709392 RepID=A0A7T0PER5_9CORY|nr:hypothetical protein [Corynebacterium qintianiae]QPK83070.1 hypothetical protein G7Y29_09550 [Corynebacterium qintianiae]